MPVLTATGSWLFDFQTRMRAVTLATTHYVFRRRVIRQKKVNGADMLYTLHTSRSSGDLLPTNEELPSVASRRREVMISIHYKNRLGGLTDRPRIQVGSLIEGT